MDHFGSGERTEMRAEASSKKRSPLSTDSSPPLMRLSEAARVLALGHTTVKRMVARGDLQAVRPTGRRAVRLLAAEVLARTLPDCAPGSSEAQSDRPDLEAVRGAHGHQRPPGAV